eukprot:450364-Karenia_brevis.AAC.1
MIWHILGDIGTDAHGARILKCRAHQSKAKIQKLAHEEQEIAAGNHEADEWAKAGAEEDTADKYHCQVLADDADKVKGIIDYMADLTVAVWHAEGCQDVMAPPLKHKTGHRQVRSRAARQQPSPKRPHRMWIISGELQCRDCPRRAATLKGRARMRAEECPGHKLASFLSKVAFGGQQARHQGHQLMQTGPWI